MRGAAAGGAGWAALRWAGLGWAGLRCAGLRSPAQLSAGCPTDRLSGHAAPPGFARVVLFESS